jgi:Exopolyphosphatase
MKLLKFAAIDIGSNAVRLLLSNVVENGDSVVFRKSSLIRMPIRLGEDAFETGIISEARIQKLIKTMIAYRNLMEVEDVVAYRACATSGHARGA